MFVLGPLAVVTMDVFPLAKFPFITANLISSIHVILSLASFRLLLSPKLGRRRLGAAFFFLRQYFDELDGMVARFWMERHLHTPGKPSLHRVFVCVWLRVFGCVCLVARVWLRVFGCVSL